MINHSTFPNELQEKDNETINESPIISKKSFIKPEKDAELNPIDYWNLYGTWEASINKKIASVTIDYDGNLLISYDKKGESHFKVKKDQAYFIVPENTYSPLTKGKTYSRFMVLTQLRFGGNFRQAQSFVEYAYLNYHIPYIRVGVDYYRIFDKKDRYGIFRKTIKVWKKETITLDHGQNILNHITLFDDFCIEPDNVSYQLSINNCYNLYAPFCHLPDSNYVTEQDIPNSVKFMKHIFGDQIEFGFNYFKVLYENPRHALPILVLVSKERQTGKTTFLNWLSVIFGDNFIQINPEDLSSQFNSSYASKNIIALDETVIDKSHAIEKLKSLVTAKSLSVNQKFTANYAVPFFGKAILCTNKETDFMRIDEEEIRFWIRKVNVINDISTNIEQLLLQEIPKFLKFLTQLLKIDYSKSRMVFTSEQLRNKELVNVMKESKSWFYEDLNERIVQIFLDNPQMNEFEAASIDIQKEFYFHDKAVNIKFIKKVLVNDFKINKSSEVSRYSPFNNTNFSKTGTPYLFKRDLFILSTENE